MGTHLLLLHGFFESHINAFEGAYWSLSLEWQFYFLFVPLAFLARRAGVLWAALVPIVFTIIFRAACVAFYPQFLQTAVGHLFSLSRWAEFGAGMLAAAIVSGSLPPRLREVFAPLQRLRLVYVWASVALAIIAEYSQISAHLMPFIWGNASLSLLVCGAQSGVLRTVLEWCPLVWLGTISYSLYLTHGVIYMAMAALLSRTEISRDARQLLYLGLGPIMAVAFAAVFFRCFEKPFLHTLKIGKKTTATIQDQAAP